MSGRSGMFVNYCWVSMHFEDSKGNRVTDIPLGAPSYRNVVTIQNAARSLPEDIKVDVILPNSPPQSNPGRHEIEFRHATCSTYRTSWTADCRSIAAKKRSSDSAQLVCATRQKQSVTVECRNGHYRDPATGQYVPWRSGSSFSEVVNLV